VSGGFRYIRGYNPTPDWLPALNASGGSEKQARFGIPSLAHMLRRPAIEVTSAVGPITSDNIPALHRPPFFSRCGLRSIPLRRGGHSQSTVALVENLEEKHESLPTNDRLKR